MSFAARLWKIPTLNQARENGGGNPSSSAETDSTDEEIKSPPRTTGRSTHTTATMSATPPQQQQQQHGPYNSNANCSDNPNRDPHQRTSSSSSIVSQIRSPPLHRAPRPDSHGSNGPVDDAPPATPTSPARSSSSSASPPLSESDTNTPRSNNTNTNWRLYMPTTNKWWHYGRWLCVGSPAFAQPTPSEIHKRIKGLARCIMLLRLYLDVYGMPTSSPDDDDDSDDAIDGRGDGGRHDQETVLRHVCRDLYAGGAPLWTLEACLQRASEGLTGQSNLNWLLLPRKALVYFPDYGECGTTSMFRIDRGFNLSRLHDIERVAVRLASYATNTAGGAGNVPMSFPTAEQLQRAYQQEAATLTNKPTPQSSEELARSILSLASWSMGLVYFVNSPDYIESVKHNPEVDDFWTISNDEQELFRRLATMDALRRIQALDASRKRLYPPWVIMAFRVLSSAGASAFWFGGSWVDMFVAGVLAVVIAWIAQTSLLSKQEKLVYEAIASFIVGITSGLIALHWTGQTCFFAMALGAVLDIFQGFRVVYSVIEVMSRQTVSGGADLLEGILFTGFIAYFLRVGLYTAASIMNNPTDVAYDDCSDGINKYFYILLVPVASLSWSGIFNPNYRDLLPMCFHGSLAYGVDYALSTTGQISQNLNSFLSALAVSLSAGLWSRFTGRQAVGNTVAGVFALVPGAYLVRNIYGISDGDLFFTILERSAAIGVGAWMGSILCSPTLLGGTVAVLKQKPTSKRSESIRPTVDNPGTMLFF